MTEETYTKTIRELSDRLVDEQRPIRILDAVKWDQSVQDEFFAKGCKELPRVDAEYYARRPLGFSIEAKIAAFQELDRDVVRKLGRFSPVGGILRRMCDEYQLVLRMLAARGTPEFATLSHHLYGSATDAFHAGDPTLADFAEMMLGSLASIDRSLQLQDEERTIPGERAVEILRERINALFDREEQAVRVFVSDGIVADAAAGADYLKIRREAFFNERDLRLLEIHEGRVHLCTTLNGMAQPVCTFLSKGPPSSTVTQEGLAIFLELLAFASHPGRLRRLTNRVRGISLAEGGATFLDVYRFFLEQGFSEIDSYTNTTRVFRGSTPSGGPFTKDLSYSKGFVLVYNFIQLAVKKGKLDRIPLLFCGKSTLEDMRTLAQLVKEGIVVPPRYLPPQFSDLNALTAWMCYSNFLGHLNLGRIESDFAGIL